MPAPPINMVITRKKTRIVEIYFNNLFDDYTYDTTPMHIMLTITADKQRTYIERRGLIIAQYASQNKHIGIIQRNKMGLQGGLYN